MGCLPELTARNEPQDRESSGSCCSWRGVPFRSDVRQIFRVKRHKFPDAHRRPAVHPSDAVGLLKPSGSPLSVARLVVVIRLLSVSGKEVEVVTSAEVASSPVLDSEVSGTIASLRERFEAVRRSEIHRVRGRLGNLSSDQEDVVESLSRGIIEKVLQSAVAMLLNAAATNQSAFVVETVRRIFNLRT